MNKKLRIVYMGTPDFAVAPLSALLEKGYNVVGVVTNPNKPAGRGQRNLASAVKKFAEAKGLPILQPEKFREEGFLAQLRDWNADLQVVVAFKMLPKVVWSMPRLGTINLHASLLPQYRGAAPINHAIINGEKQTGITTFLLDQEIDTGAILLQEQVAILQDDTAGSLHDKLMEKGAELVVATVALLNGGVYEAIPQKEESGLSVAPKIFKEDCRIDWKEDGQAVYNFIRGLSPYPAAWTSLKKQNKEISLKIFRCSFEEGEHYESAGTLLSDGKSYLKVAVSGGYILIKELQQAGKKAMQVVDFLRGFPMTQDAVVLS